MNILDGLAFHLFGRLIARQFVVFGGVPAALRRGNVLSEEGIIPTYNRIDEHVRDREQVEQIVASYVQLLHTMDSTNQGHIAVKPSALGMEFGPFLFAQNLNRLTLAAKDMNLEIEIDAENRETLGDVQRVLNALAPKLPKGITFRPAFQMHLPEVIRRELIARHRILNMPVRIVKGSGLYSVGKEEVGVEEMLAHYEETFLDQIGKGIHPNMATVRDRKLIESMTEVATRKHVPLNRFTVQFLDGPFGRSLMRECVAGGYRVGCYVTFVDPSAPDEWKGYVKRRIAFGRKLMFG